MPATIKNWLSSSADQLQLAGIDSANLDCEIILSHTIKKPRTYLHAHPEEEITARELEIANARLDLRLDRTPIAYIVGHKEFYGRQFKVTTATLIPRPESEDIITLVKKLYSPSDHSQLVDVGTGSGCLGITIKLELPDLDVSLIDISKQALSVASSNADNLGAKVDINTGNLLIGYLKKPDIIVANLPYVDKSWDVSPETSFEPESALYADKEGLALIYKLIDQSSNTLSAGGLLILEADPRQHRKISSYALAHNFSPIEKAGYCLAFKRD